MVESERRRLERDMRYRSQHEMLVKRHEGSIDEQEKLRVMLDKVKLPVKELEDYLDSAHIFKDTAPGLRLRHDTMSFPLPSSSPHPPRQPLDVVAYGTTPDSRRTRLTTPSTPSHDTYGTTPERVAAAASYASSSAAAASYASSSPSSTPPQSRLLLGAPSPIKVSYQSASSGVYGSGASHASQQSQPPPLQGQISYQGYQAGIEEMA